MSQNILDVLRNLGRQKYERNLDDDPSSPVDFPLQQIHLEKREGVLAFETMEIIFSYLGFVDLLKTICFVCKGWNLMSSTSQIWENKYRLWFTSIHLAKKETNFIDVSWKHSFLLRLESRHRWRSNQPIISYFNLTKEEFDHPERVAAREKMKEYRKRVRYFPGEWEYGDEDDVYSSEEEKKKKKNRRKFLPISQIAISTNYVAIFDDEVILLDKKTLQKIGTISVSTTTKKRKIMSFGNVMNLRFLEGTDLLSMICQPFFHEQIEEDEEEQQQLEEEEEEKKKKKIKEIDFVSLGRCMLYILGKPSKKSNVWEILYEEEFGVGTMVSVNAKRSFCPYLMLYETGKFKFVVKNQEGEIIKKEKEVHVPHEMSLEGRGGMMMRSEWMDYYPKDDIMCFLGMTNVNDVEIYALQFFHVKFGVHVQTIPLKGSFEQSLPISIKFREGGYVFVSGQENILVDYKSGKMVSKWGSISIPPSRGYGARAVGVIGDFHCFVSDAGQLSVADLYSGECMGVVDHNNAGGYVVSMVADEMNFFIATQFGAVIKRFYGPKEFYWSNMKGNVLIEDEEENDDPFKE